MKNQTGRLAAIEAHLAGGAVRLQMADGSTRIIDGGRLPEMMFAMFRGEVDEDTRAIVASVSDDCYAVCGNHLTEVIRVSAHAESHQGEDNDNTEGMEVVIQ
jgi:hypothetical protein